MTEEIKQEIAEEVKQEVVLSDIEQEAVAEGWQPKEDWIKAGHKEEDWRSAKEFKERGELFRKIDNLASELKNTRSTMAALKGHYEKVKEVEFKRALDTLKAEKKAAFDAGDSDAIIDIDDKILEIKAVQKAQEQQVEAAPAIHPEFSKWVESNSWYTSNPEMQGFADSIGRAYASTNPGIDPVTVLKYVTTKVKQAYPDKFQNQRRTAPSPVEGGTTQKKTATPEFELTEDEQRVMDKLVRQKVMTKEKYIESIKNLRKA